MPPKKTESATKPEGAAAPKPKSGSSHPSYQAMITDAIVNLKDRNGSSRQSLKKYVKANNKLGDVTDTMFDSLFNRALKNGVDKGVFEQPKGPSGGTKLAKKVAPPKKEAGEKAKKPAAPKKEAGEKAKKPAAKKAAAPKKETVAKEKKEPKEKKPAAAPKKEKKEPKEKKAAAAPKKAAAADKALTKTKTGRVTKAAAAKPAAKKAAPAKKAATAKKPAAKKAAEPAAAA